MANFAEIPCPHHSLDPAGTVGCGCGGQKDVYRCDHAAVGGFVSIHAIKPRHKDVRLKDRGPDGKLRARLPTLSVPACILCPHRPEATQELKDLVGQEVPTPNPNAPAGGRGDCLDDARQAICGNCPRINATGQQFECPGAEAAECPLDLWPSIQRPKRGKRSGGCRGC